MADSLEWFVSLDPKQVFAKNRKGCPKRFLSTRSSRQIKRTKSMAGPVFARAKLSRVRRIFFRCGHLRGKIGETERRGGFGPEWVLRNVVYFLFHVLGFNFSPNASSLPADLRPIPSEVLTCGPIATFPLRAALVVWCSCLEAAV